MISYCDTADGEVHQQELLHQKDDVRAFYQQLPGAVIVGWEASGYGSWFEEMLESLGHQACDLHDQHDRVTKHDATQDHEKPVALLVVDLLLGCGTKHLY